MSMRKPGAAKALFVLTAIGLLLSGCYYHRPYYGGAYYAPPSSGYKHHYHGKEKHRGYGHHSHGYRGYHY